MLRIAAKIVVNDDVLVSAVYVACRRGKIEFKLIGFVNIKHTVRRNSRLSKCDRLNLVPLQPPTSCESLFADRSIQTLFKFRL